MSADGRTSSPQVSPDEEPDNPTVARTTRRGTPEDAKQLARWGAGMVVATGRYLVMRVPLYRRDRAAGGGTQPPDLMRELPGDPATLQRAADGVGPLFHRRYWIDMTDTTTDAEGLIDVLARRLDDVAPTEFSSFEHTRTSGGSGDDPDGDLHVGDELVVKLIGPWDGPVRVVERTPRSFTFATLRGHMEAGQITFRAYETDQGLLRFEIDSWARSGDRRYDYVYDHVPLAREAQLLMWSHFCQRAAQLSGGIIMSNVAVTTRRYEWDADTGQLRAAHITAPISNRALRRLPSLKHKGLNFDPDQPEVETDGWHIDDYRADLPAEEPGEPTDGGSWETARHLIADYAFVDPAIVRAAWYPDEPLDGRNMALEGRFFGLRFILGLRISEVVDDTVEVDGRPVRRWGWSYRTLEDHLEMGDMDYTVWKWMDTGDVEFRVHAFSKPAAIDNPAVRFGFALFGRTMQVRFARRAVRRLTALVERELSGTRHRLQPG